MRRFFIRRAWRWPLASAVVLPPILLAAAWVAAHRVPGFGPFAADTLRAAAGPRAVAWLEDTAYGVQDWVNLRTRAGEKPEPLWEVPTTATAPRPHPADAGIDAGPTGPPPFQLPNVGPMIEDVAAEGDGVWVPMVDPRRPDDETRLLKTVLHPDRKRGWGYVAVVAADLRRVALHPVVGRFEPESRTAEAHEYERRAVVPPEHHDRLLAAFNGCYKSTHGYYGMKVDGVVIMPPRVKCCVIAELDNRQLMIRDWETVAEQEPRMVWWRQAPICMFENGKPHKALADPNIPWGASSVGGTTVIRRSALGLSRDGKVLFVGMGDHLTAKGLGHALHHAGAHHVAQLDVNYSFPKFVTYDWAAPGSTELVAVPLTKNFEYAEDQYIGTRSHRDFFYLTRAEPPKPQSSASTE